MKRGPKSWAVVVYLGRDPQTGKERRKWYSDPTRREAEAHLARLLDQLHGGGTIPTTKERVGEYLAQWLRDYAAGAVGPVTLASYEQTVRNHLAPALGHLPLLRLSPQAIHGYYSAKLQEGLSPTTVRYHAAVLRKALYHAVKWGLLVRNPADLASPPKRAKHELQVWDEEQVRLFLAEAKRASPYYRLYLMAMLTGMRMRELLALRWQDVDLALGVASVHQTFYRLGRRQIVKEPKTAKAAARWPCRRRWCRSCAPCGRSRPNSARRSRAPTLRGT